MTLSKKRKEERRIERFKDKEWATLVKDSCENKCVICGEEKRLNAHHIIPRQRKQFRWNVNNGIALCPRHHRFSFELSAHQNPLAFFKWMKENRPNQLNYLESILK